MSKLTITRGPIRNAMKVVIYGPEGIGKTTLASRFPNPLFIDTEGSTKFLDVARTPPPKSWAQLLDQVSSVWENPSVCGTLVLDTADWAEQLCTAAFCASKKISGIEELGYGKGYVYLAEDFARLLNTLGEIADKGVHVVLTAHAKMRKFEQPDELGAYDRWELKLQKSVAPLVKEWSDLLLFANYKTFAVAVDKEGRRHKAQGGKRVIYTSHHPCWDAKNRLGLPEELPMEYGPLAPYFGGNATPPPASAQVAGDGSPRGATPTDSPAGVPPVGAGALARPSPDEPHPSPDEPRPSPESAQAAEERAGTEPGPYIPPVLRPLLESAGVTEEAVRQVIAKRQGSFPLGTPWEAMEKVGFVEGWVLPFWDKIVAMIREDS